MLALRAKYGGPSGRLEFITSKISTNCYERYFDSCYDMIIPVIFWTNI